MEKIINKISETELEVIEKETTETKNVYKLDYLLSQREAIQAQKDRDDAQRDLELSQVDELISLCEEKGIQSQKMLEENKEEKIEEPILEESEELSEVIEK